MLTMCTTNIILNANIFSMDQCHFGFVCMIRSLLNVDCPMWCCDVFTRVLYPKICWCVISVFASICHKYSLFKNASGIFHSVRTQSIIFQIQHNRSINKKNQMSMADTRATASDQNERNFVRLALKEASPASADGQQSIPGRKNSYGFHFSQYCHMSQECN